MLSMEETVLLYRHALRNVLSQAGVPSNPGVDDEWILEQASLKLTGHSIKWIVCPNCQKRFPGEGSFHIHRMSDCRN